MIALLVVLDDVNVQLFVLGSFVFCEVGLPRVCYDPRRAGTPSARATAPRRPAPWWAPRPTTPPSSCRASAGPTRTARACAWAARTAVLLLRANVFRVGGGQGPPVSLHPRTPVFVFAFENTAGLQELSSITTMNTWRLMPLPRSHRSFVWPNRGHAYKCACRAPSPGKGVDAITSGLEGAWTTSPAKWDHGYFENLFKVQPATGFEPAPHRAAPVLWTFAPNLPPPQPPSRANTIGQPHFMG